MFLTRGKPQRGRMWGFQYWTAWTTTTTTLASSWGLLINIDSATGDISTAVWYIEDEKYGFYLSNTANAVSGEFDSAVTRTGRLTLKASTTNITGRWRVFSYVPARWAWLIPLKTSTKYKFWVWVKSTNCTQITWNLFSAPDQANFWTLTQRASLNLSLGTTDWTYYTTTFTSHATDTIYAPQFRCETAWNISDFWIDVNSMTLEEVVEPIANSLTTPSPSLVSFTAVGSMDNIDQSQLTINSTLSFSTVAQYQAQQFTPTKSKVTWVTFQKTSNTWSPTGTMTFTIVNDSAWSPWTTVYATYTYSNASWLALSNNVDTTVNLPCNLVAGTAYWLKISYSVSSATDFPKINSCTPSLYAGLFKYWIDGITYWVTFAWDAYFKTLYYKPTTNFKASQNNLSLSISADEDGFLNGAIINKVNWTFTWNSLIWATWYDTNPYNCDYSRTVWTWNATTGNRIISSATNAEWIFKLPTWLTNISCTFTSTVWWGSTCEIASSLDNISYTVASTGTFGSTSTLLDWARYLRLKSQWTTVKLETLTLSATYDVSALSTLKNYPTNKDIIKQYSTTLGSPSTSATYRGTKWGFPAIEYSATEYQFLDVDTTATGSTVAFSELWTSYTTVADGASLAITSTSTPNLFVKANITANRLYVSSNDFNASSDKDGSLKQSLVYQIVQ